MTISVLEAAKFPIGTIVMFGPEPLCGYVVTDNDGLVVTFQRDRWYWRAFAWLRRTWRRVFA